MVVVIVPIQHHHLLVAVVAVVLVVAVLVGAVHTLHLLHQPHLRLDPVLLLCLDHSDHQRLQLWDIPLLLQAQVQLHIPVKVAPLQLRDITLVGSLLKVLLHPLLPAHHPQLQWEVDMEVVVA